MAQVCAIMTLLAVVPSCFNLLNNPRKDKFLLSLINCSLAFYLFSFQVNKNVVCLSLLRFDGDGQEKARQTAHNHLNFVPSGTRKDHFAGGFASFAVFPT